MFNEAQINQISEEISTVTLKDINTAFHQEIDKFSQDFNIYLDRIKILINNLIRNMEIYQNWSKQRKGIGNDITKFEVQRDLIYKDFFELQNLINMLIGQKIIMTYVQTDPNTGKREIRIFDNNIDHLKAMSVNNYGRTYAKLGYELSERYSLLKNSLPDDINAGLQITAAEVEARYARYKGRILWKLNSEWLGYKLSNRGPINEAFVDFYLKEIQLNNGLNNNLHYFMTSVDPQGVIQADNANGFLIGDVSIGKLQFAVKGAFGSPQNFTMIINWLKQIRDQDFSFSSFQDFIHRFKAIEQEKATKLVKPMTKKSIEGMIRYHGDKLMESLVNGIK